MNLVLYLGDSATELTNLLFHLDLISLPHLLKLVSRNLVKGAINDFS